MTMINFDEVCDLKEFRNRFENCQICGMHKKIDVNNGMGSYGCDKCNYKISFVKNKIGDKKSKEYKLIEITFTNQKKDIYDIKEFFNVYIMKASGNGINLFGFNGVDGFENTKTYPIKPYSLKDIKNIYDNILVLK